MLTYQDFTVSTDKLLFIKTAINEHINSDAYKIAEIAQKYDRQLNPTITEYKKYLYNMAGQKYQDEISANNKIASNFFNQIITQENQFLLGNGVFFDDMEIKNNFKQFDVSVQKTTRAALVAGIAFGYYSNGKITTFKLTEFVPLWDEETGALRAGIRFYRIDPKKPRFIELYEEDGITKYTQVKDADVKLTQEKRPYITVYQGTAADGMQAVAGKNYGKLPIVPMYGNPNKQSELVGRQAQIDAYDLTLSGLQNDIDENSFIYWIVKNAGGMDMVDLIQLKENLKTAGIANVDSDAGGGIEHFSKDIPYEARKVALEKLEEDIYRDFGALNVKHLAGGNKTATEINASYQPLEDKCSQFEYEVIEFIQGILDIAGIEAEPYFKRQKLENEFENSQITASKVSSLMMIAQELDDRTLLKVISKIVPELSEIDVDQVMQAKDEFAQTRVETE